MALGVNAKVGMEKVSWNFFGRPPKVPDDTDSVLGKGDWQQDVWDNYEKSLSFGVKSKRNVLFHGAMGAAEYGHMFRGLDIMILPW